MVLQFGLNFYILAGGRDRKSISVFLFVKGFDFGLLGMLLKLGGISGDGVDCVGCTCNFLQEVLQPPYFFVHNVVVFFFKEKD